MGAQFIMLRIIQSVHIKCIPFYCNVAHELKGRGMKTKRIWADYMIKFVTLGGVVVSVLATGPKVAGSIPGEDDGF
jgi:hypothetical protein